MTSTYTMLPDSSVAKNLFEKKELQGMWIWSLGQVQECAVQMELQERASCPAMESGVRWILKSYNNFQANSMLSLSLAPQSMAQQGVAR